MKLITAFALLILSTSLFAATPYSFKCTTASDGNCNINTNNAHVMTLTSQTGVYGGTEGEHRMFYIPENGASYLFVYKGETEVAQSQGDYLAVPVAGGYVGVLIVNSLSDIPAFIKPQL